MENHSLKYFINKYIYWSLNLTGWQIFEIVYKYNCYIFMLNYVDFHFILFRLYKHPILGSKS